MLLLLLYFYLQICNNNIFHTIIQEIDVGCAYNALGNEKSKALLGVYAFTGCDLTGRFSRFSKTTCFNRFLKRNSIVHKEFASLGNNDDGLKEEILDGLSKFLLDLYQPKRPSNINTLRQLRQIQFWKATSYVFCSSLCNISKSSCVQHLERVIVSSSIISKSWRIWLGIRYQHEAVMTDQLPAPRHIVELCICKCKKGYDSLPCSCKKNKLVCNMHNDCKNCPNEELIINKESWDT